jgi:hypothetical protein
MMFKILVLQATNNLSDERAEFLTNDRLSSMRFLRTGVGGPCSGRPHDLAVLGETDDGRGDQEKAKSTAGVCGSPTRGKQLVERTIQLTKMEN